MRSLDCRIAEKANNPEGQSQVLVDSLAAIRSHAETNDLVTSCMGRESTQAACEQSGEPLKGVCD